MSTGDNADREARADKTFEALKKLAGGNVEDMGAMLVDLMTDIGESDGFLLLPVKVLNGDNIMASVISYVFPEDKGCYLSAYAAVLQYVLNKTSPQEVVAATRMVMEDMQDECKTKH